MAIFTNKETFEDATLDTVKFKDDPKWVLRKQALSKTNIIENFTIPNVAKKYLKWVNNKPVEMSQAEKTAVDQAEAEAVQLAIENKKDITKTDKLIKAFALVVLDEINILRARASLSARTVEDLVNAIKAKYE